MRRLLQQASWRSIIKSDSGSSPLMDHNDGDEEEDDGLFRSLRSILGGGVCWVWGKGVCGVGGVDGGGEWMI